MAKVLIEREREIRPVASIQIMVTVSSEQLIKQTKGLVDDLLFGALLKVERDGGLGEVIKDFGDGTSLAIRPFRLPRRLYNASPLESTVALIDNRRGREAVTLLLDHQSVFDLPTPFLGRVVCSLVEFNARKV